VSRASRILPSFAVPALLWQVVAGVGSSLWVPYRAALVFGCLAAVVWERRSSHPFARAAAIGSTIGLFWAGALEATLGGTSLLLWELSFFPTMALVHAAVMIWRSTPTEPGLLDGVLRRAALVVAVLGSSLFLLEGACRLAFGLHTYDSVSDDPTRGACLFKGPDGRGRAIPDYRGKYVHREFSGVRVEINAFGLRDGLDEATPPAAGEVPFIALGDSFTFGLGVALEDTFQEQLEAAHPRLRVYGAGIPGYGPVHARGMLEDLLLVVQPAAVVYALCEGNDFQDTAWAKLVEQAPAPPPESAPVPAPKLPARRALDQLRRPEFWRDTSALKQVGSHRGTGLPSVFMKHALSGQLTEEHAAMTPGVVDALTSMQARCRALGAEFFVLLIPSPVQADPARFEQYVSVRLGADPADYTRTGFHEELGGRLRDAGLTVVDPMLELEASIAGGEPCYHVEGHWNAAGHRAAGSALRAALAPLLPND
jgi:hypothetical protein